MNLAASSTSCGGLGGHVNRMGYAWARHHAYQDEWTLLSLWTIADLMPLVSVGLSDSNLEYQYRGQSYNFEGMQFTTGR